MKRCKLIGIIAMSAAMILSNSVLANPSRNSTLNEIPCKVVELASKSWVCAKCGFHIVTKSGNKPSSGECSKNDNGPHVWEEGD